MTIQEKPNKKCDVIFDKGSKNERQCQGEFPDYSDGQTKCIGCRGGKPIAELAKIEDKITAELTEITEFQPIQIKPNEDLLAEVVGLYSKTVKGDDIYIQRILFNGLSCFTKAPNHLMTVEKTSEGKTYPVLEIAKYFPKENIIVLSDATPQSFKYQHGVLVDENYNPIQDVVDDLEKKIEELKKTKQSTTDLEKKRKDILKNSKTLIDLREKWIIFKEPPHTKLLEALYSTLSADEEFNEKRFVSQTARGKPETFAVVLRGTPAMLICTARDESRHERHSETQSRFEITSPHSSPEKYRGGMDLIAMKYGLPSSIQKKFIINQDEKDHIKRIILTFREIIKKNNGEVFNPFVDLLAELFPQEIGVRWRQFQRFQNLMNLHCFCNSYRRPEIMIDGVYFPVVVKSDIKWANEIIESIEALPPNKITWFTQVFIPTFKEYNCQPITIAKLVEYVEKQGGKTFTRQIRQVYLNPLFESGYIDMEMDLNQKTRNIYSPVSMDVSVFQSPFKSLSPFNASCVKSCLRKYVEGTFKSKSGTVVLTEDDFINLVVDVKDD